MEIKEEVMDVPTHQLFRKLFTRRNCPARQELAGYVDRQLIGPRRHVVERHLASCDACVQQVAFLVRTAEMNGEPVPAEIMNSAFALAKRDVRRTYPGWRLAVSGAFGVFILGIIGWQILQHRSAPYNGANGRTVDSPTITVAENQTAPATQDNLVRGTESSDSPFLFPVSKQKVNAANLTFRWRTVPAAALYEIEVVADDGSIVWSEKLKSSSVALPSKVHLVKDATYFVRLRIHNVRGSVDVTKAIEFIAD